MLAVLQPLFKRPICQAARLLSTLNQQQSVSKVLLEEADKKDKKKASAPSTYSTGGNDQPVRKTATAWKPFEGGRFIRPHQLTYKYRSLDTTRPRSRPPVVGPGSAESRYGDVFHQLGIDPLDQCMNPQLLAHFVSDMGKIYGRNVTKLTTRTQRRLGKAIRRAKMMGVIPILSKPRKASWIYRR
ncbi:hypothetical protein ONZ45_g122 [Pleurotus djamor]|nr:hypothetical protein ONZ45_g122 [Pleurotus djamor]